MLYTLPPLVLVRATARSLPSRTETEYHNRDAPPVAGLLLVPVLAMAIYAFSPQCSGRSRVALEPRRAALPGGITGALWGAGNLCSLHSTKFLDIASRLSLHFSISNPGSRLRSFLLPPLPFPAHIFTN